MKIIGIDPGLEGAIATIISDGSGTAARAVRMPLRSYGEIDAMAIADIVGGADIVVIERAQSMPRMSSVAMFNYGKGFGVLLAACDITRTPYVLIRPQIWQKNVCPGVIPQRPPKKDGIERSRQLAEHRRNVKSAVIGWVSHRFPELEKVGPLTNGMADATCLACYGLRNFGPTKA